MREALFLLFIELIFWRGEEGYTERTHDDSSSKIQHMQIHPRHAAAVHARVVHLPEDAIIRAQLDATAAALVVELQLRTHPSCPSRRVAVAPRACPLCLTLPDGVSA